MKRNKEHERFLGLYSEGYSSKEAASIVNNEYNIKLNNRVIGGLIKAYEDTPFEIVLQRKLEGVCFTFRAIPSDTYAWSDATHPRVFAACKGHQWGSWSIEILAGGHWHSFDYDTFYGSHEQARAYIQDELKVVDFYNSLSINIHQLPLKWIELIRPVLRKEIETLPETRTLGLTNFNETKLLEEIP